MNDTLAQKLKAIHTAMLERVNTYLTEQRTAICQIVEKELAAKPADEGCRALIETYLEEADELKGKLFKANRLAERSFNLLDQSQSYATDTITSIEEALNTLDEMTTTLQDTYKEAA